MENNKWKETEQSTRDVWNPCKSSNIHVIIVSGKEGRQQDRTIFET